MKKILLLLLFILTSSLHCDELNPSFEEIKVMPSSYAKDFYIWRLIQEKKTTKKQALDAYQWTKRKGAKLRKAIKKKAGYIPKNKSAVKKKRDPKNFIISPASASKKTLKARKRLYKKIEAQGKYSDVLKVFATDKPFDNLHLVSAKTQAYILNGVSSKYRKKYFNHTFSSEQLLELSNEKQFNTTIHKIVTTPKLQKAKKSLVFDSGINKLSFQGNFLLAMNAVEFSKINHAINFLCIARTKTTHQTKHDQVDFWLYLLTDYKGFLEPITKSTQISLYALRANDILKTPYPKVITPVFETKSIKDFNITNPIDWEKIKLKMQESPTKLDALAENYKSAETLGIYTYLKEKASKYTVPYYPLPYFDAMNGFTKERQAILYAIARQESRFVPASVSPSYALGMMQVMPFLIKHLSKERNEKMDLNKMFDPYVAISYADQHMDYLDKWLYHPLFTAYAYNGGIGFTKRRVLKTKHLFKKGKYEPYLSMELIDYVESRDYGKKVLANYVIYLNLIGKETRISPLLSSLEYPSQTDRFRK